MRCRPWGGPLPRARSGHSTATVAPLTTSGRGRWQMRRARRPNAGQATHKRRLPRQCTPPLACVQGMSGYFVLRRCRTSVPNRQSE
eukprot:7801141-Pyramimonas_sp.AAC.1